MNRSVAIKLYFIAFLFLTIPLSCSVDNIDPIDIIHIAGGKVVDGEYKAHYWEVKEEIITSTVLSSNSSWAYSVYASGNDVHVVGWVTANGKRRAAYWKNGTETLLTTNEGEAKSVFVQGSDVYVAGFEYRESGIWTSTRPVAKVWKNGVGVNLGDDSQDSYASAVFVSGADVYVSGGQYTEPNSVYRPSAKYWKNGIEHELTDRVQFAHTQSIFVSGSVVYVAGTESPFIPGTAEQISIPVYWKDGAETLLQDGVSSTNGGSTGLIYVSDSDVYVAGSNHSQAMYWKNDKAVVLGDQGTVNSIFISGTDVHAGGTRPVGSNTIATYWKNGTPVSLTDGINSFVTSVFVTRQ